MKDDSKYIVAWSSMSYLTCDWNIYSDVLYSGNEQYFGGFVGTLRATTQVILIYV